MSNSNKKRKSIAFWLLKIPLFVILVGIAWFLIALISALVFPQGPSGLSFGKALGTSLTIGTVRWLFIGGGGYFSIIYANRITNKVVNKILSRSDGV